MPSRRERALVKLICQMSYRDAVEVQMDSLLDSKQGIQSATVRRMLEREISRLRKEFNLAQAKIEAMRGRSLPVNRESPIIDDTPIDPHAAIAECNCTGFCSACTAN